MIPVTVIEAGPCYVTQVKTKDVDGYAAVQLGFESVEQRKLNLPQRGHLRQVDHGNDGQDQRKEEPGQEAQDQPFSKRHVGTLLKRPFDLF